MSQIHIDYAAVEAGTSTLRASMDAALREADTTLSGLRSSMDTKDSASNARFIEAIDLNQRKIQSTAHGFTKLLNFISGSSRQLQMEDARLSTQFTSARLVRPRVSR